MIFGRKLRWRQIGSILDIALILYLAFLMIKFLIAGETEMFLLATIAKGVWCLSCVLSNLLFNPAHQAGSEGA